MSKMKIFSPTSAENGQKWPKILTIAARFLVIFYTKFFVQKKKNCADAHRKIWSFLIKIFFVWKNFLANTSLRWEILESLKPQLAYYAKFPLKKERKNDAPAY